MRNHQSARVIVLVLTMLAFVSLACGGIPLPKLRSGQAAQQPPTSESTQPPLVPGATGPVAQPLPATVLPLGTSSGATTNYKVGDVISYGDLTLVVLGWSVSPKDYRGFAADPGNKYVLVDLVLFNRSGRQLPVNLFGAKLRDVSGQEYTFNGPVPFDGEFNPGERARGQLPIQVPEASTGDFTVTFNPGGIGEAAITVNLGTQPVSLEPPAELLAPEANASEMGQPITHGDVTLTVLGWRLSPGDEKSRPAPGTKLVVVDVTLTNRGSQALEFVPRDHMTLRDASLRQYEHDTRFEHMPNKLGDPFITASPGETVRFALVFQVPEASGGYLLIYKGSQESADAEVYVKLSAEPMAVELPAGQASVGVDVHPIGQAIVHGDLVLAVLGWDISKGDEGRKPAEGHQFVLVNLMVVNRGAQTRSFPLQNMTLRDADLNQYQVEWNYYDYFDYMAFPTSSSISPGERGRGWIAFQAPETSSGYVFALDAAPNGGDNIFVALGPEPAAFEPPAEMLTPNPNARRVGEVIKQGDVALAVLGWNTSQGRVGVQPDPGHKFLVVDAMLVSRSSQAENLYTPALEPEVRDASGYRYKTDPEHYYGDQPAASLFEGGLTPGEQVRGQFLYQVREASSGYVFIFDPKWLFGEDGGDLIVVDLGAQPVSLEPPAELLTP